MKTYGLGIIGFGGMATYHAKVLKSLSRVKIIGIYDINEEKESKTKDFDCKWFASQEELLNDESIDLVLVATSNEVHKDICIAAMRAGKDVVCEKPVTIYADELEDVIKVKNETGRFFTINQNRRLDRDFLTLMKNLDAGTIGKPYVIESRVEGSRGVPLGWRCIKALGGGMMLDWGVHMIDQVLQMGMGNVKTVYCNMFSIFYPEVDDNFKLTLTFDTGVVANIEVGTNNYIQHPRWYVLGEKGSLQIDDWDINGRIVVKEEDEGFEEQIVYSKAGPTKTMAPRSEKTMKTLELERLEGLDDGDGFEDNLAATYLGFIDAIEGKSEQPITAEQVLEVMKVIDASFESAQKGIAVQL